MCEHSVRNRSAGPAVQAARPPARTRQCECTLISKFWNSRGGSPASAFVMNKIVIIIQNPVESLNTADK